MTLVRRINRLLLPPLMLVLLCAAPAGADFNLHVRIVETDPQAGGALEIDQQLFFRLAYQSDIPLVFRFSAYSRGQKLEYGFYTGYPELQSAGEGEALGWIGFTNVTHIDEVRVAILNARREKIGEIVKPFPFSWKEPGSVAGQRKKPGWVARLQRHQDWLRDRLSDPFAQRERTLRDWLFYLNVVSVPLYLLLQAYALYRFRGRWRDLATIPLVSLAPLVFASLVGFGMELRYWVVFIFRGTPFALLFMVVLWWFRRRSLRREKNRL